MDSRQAKTVLACYRPGVDDPRSEPFAEALEQARRDPELARWLERELALDAAIGAKLREAPVPPGLESRILAGQPAVAPPWWRTPFVAVASASAVVIAVIALVALMWMRPPGDFASYRRNMTTLVAGDYKLDVESESLSELREFFAKRGWPADYTVPARLEGYPLEGGMAVEWRAKRVSVVCFGAEDDEGKDLWLFVTARGTLPDAPRAEVPRFARESRLMTASWSAGGNVYLLAGRGDEASLREWLGERTEER